MLAKFTHIPNVSLQNAGMSQRLFNSLSVTRLRRRPNFETRKFCDFPLATQNCWQWFIQWKNSFIHKSNSIIIWSENVSRLPAFWHFENNTITVYFNKNKILVCIKPNYVFICSLIINIFLSVKYTIFKNERWCFNLINVK